jgi:hypothetical protein
VRFFVQSVQEKPEGGDKGELTTLQARVRGAVCRTRGAEEQWRQGERSIDPPGNFLASRGQGDSIEAVGSEQNGRGVRKLVQMILSRSKQKNLCK